MSLHVGGGGGGGSHVAWCKVTNSVAQSFGNVATSFPIDAFSSSSPQPAWCTFTITNGVLLLDPGIYTFQADLAWETTALDTGSVRLSAESWQGYIYSHDGRSYPTVVLPAFAFSFQGFIDADDPLTFYVNPVGWSNDLTNINCDLTVIKLT